jgi:transposase, IS5 family
LYLLQKSLFSFEQWLEIESAERLELFFSALDLQPYAAKLRSSSPQGAKPINREAILRALLAAPLEGISTFTRLHERLVKDIRFRYQCGFRLDEPAPSISTLSRVFSALTEKGLAKTLFIDLVSQCRESSVIDGSHLAIDSTAISAYEKKQPKSRSQETGNSNWGAKYDTFGNKLTWFGYKIHLAVDTHSELPISQVKNYEAARSYGAQAIIALNRRREKEPPAGMSSNGTPRCSMGYDMVYWGADGDRLKFRCPHVLGKVDCPLGAAACSDSNYGMVLKQNIADDVRRFSNPHRNTRGWTELYNERTAVERCNSRLKEHLTANDVHVSGIDKVTTHVYVNAIVLLASALAMSNNAANKEQVA